MSRLLFGNRMQFLHILLTRSSLITTISWLQYWILTEEKHGRTLLVAKNRKTGKSTSCTQSPNNTIQYLHILNKPVLPARVSSEHWKRHPLSELLCDVIRQGRPEGQIYQHSLKPLTIMLWKCGCHWGLTWAGWFPGQGPQGQEQTRSDCCRCRMTTLESNTLTLERWRRGQRGAGVRALLGHTCCECWDVHR